MICWADRRFELVSAIASFYSQMQPINSNFEDFAGPMKILITAVGLGDDENR